MIGANPNGSRGERSVMALESLGDGTKRLDVREIDGEPFDDIMAALETLESDETLRLVNSFEPEPLYAVLETRGFRYEATEIDDEWRIDIELERA